MRVEPALPPRLARDMTEPEPIPEAGIRRANELLRSGRLFRYGELGADQGDAALLETEFAALIGRRFCIAVNSGGAAIFLALKVLDVAPGEPVLVNGFTLAPVPGAILHAGAVPVLVEVGEDYVIDLADLRDKARASGARILLLSHMRGHLPDMDAVSAICAELGLTLVEDCAHALLASWGDRTIGTFGAAAAFSAQTYKHLNSGEGGFLVLDDPDRAARAILHSGSYMLHGQHVSSPGPDRIAPWEGATPNFSMRMTALAAALLRPQLEELPQRVERWNAIHARIADGLVRLPHVRLPRRDPRERFSATSVQFTLEGLDNGQISAVLQRCGARGLPIKWFGSDRQSGFTSAPRHWDYVPGRPELATTHRVLAGLCDIRTPLGLTDAECDLVVDIVADAIAATTATNRRSGSN